MAKLGQLFQAVGCVGIIAGMVISQRTQYEGDYGLIMTGWAFALVGFVLWIVAKYRGA